MDTNLKISIEVRNLLLLLTKSENAAVVDFLQMETLNQRRLYNGILMAIEKAIRANDQVDFKELSRILALFSDVNIFPNLTSYFNCDDNPLEVSNVVIMASKHNRIEILSHIFSDTSSIISDLSTKIGRPFPLPTEKDEEGHDAFYYAIRSGNTKLLELLMKKWRRNNSSIQTEEMCTLLCKNLNELLMKNVDVSNEMKIFINSILLDYYFKENPPSDSSDYSHDDIQESISLILECSQSIQNYKRREYKDVVIFSAKKIALNIMILKKRLKSTYERIPWEEMEFHLISFIRFLINQGSYVNCCITETDFVNYLDIFCKCLVEETKEIKSMELKILRKLPENIKRDDVVSSITSNYPEFKEFYQNYELIRDHESLVIIKKYVDIVTDVNALEKSGKTIIVRALQVVGENFKNTLESPKISTATNEYLLSHLPDKTSTILKTLRNSFSHGFPLTTCREIEENYGSDFYTSVQNDIRSLNDGITSVFQKIKYKILRILIKKMCDCEDGEVLQETVGMIRGICSDTEILHLFPKNDNVAEVEKLVSDLEKILKKTHSRETLFSTIAEIISSEKENLRNSEVELQKWILNLYYSTFDSKQYDFDFHLAKDYINLSLENVDSLLSSQKLKVVPRLLMEVIVNSEGELHDLNLYEYCIMLIYKICYIIENPEHEVKQLQKLKKTYEKSVKITHEKIKTIKSSPSTCYQDIVSNDMTALRKIVQNYHFHEANIESFFIFKNNAKLQAEIEMLLLSILSSLEDSKLYLITSQQSDEYGNPLLVGKHLRNYLAHGNCLLDVLMDSTQFLFLFALKITKYDIYREENITTKRERINTTISKTIVENQERLFCALSSNSLDDVMHWIKKGADIYGRDRNLMTALHFASKSSNINILKFLITCGLNPKVKDSYGRNLLHVSAASGCKEVVDYIIRELGISVDDKCENEQSALHIAAENGCVDVVKTLLCHHGNYCALDVCLHTPIHKAALNNRLDILKLFLQNVKDVNSIYDKDGYTLLHIAAGGGFLDMVVYLLNKGADVDSVGSVDSLITPLHLSSWLGRLEIVGTLVSRGSNVNAKMKGDYTPLHMAVQSGNLSVVEYLLKHGANISALSCTEDLPLYHALERERMNIFKTLINKGASLEDIDIRGYQYAFDFRNRDLTNYLIDNGVDINLRYQEDITLLHLSIVERSNDISKLLIERGADINAVTKHGFTPLALSIICVNLDIARTLLEKGVALSTGAVNGMTLLHWCAAVPKYGIACFESEYLRCHNFDGTDLTDVFNIFQTLVKVATEVMSERAMEWVHEKDSKGDTALHHACGSGNLDIVQYLCSKMSFIDIPNEKGYTPLHSAVDSNHLEIVKLLISSRKCALNSMTSKGLTALCLSAKNNSTDIAKLLIKNKADKNAGDPLNIAINGRCQDACLLLIRRNKMYLEKQGKIEEILRIASIFCLDRVVSYILEHKLLSEKLALEKCFHLSIFFDHEEVLTLFLDYGVDVNHVYENSNTPLHVAVDKGHSRIIKILLDRGADINRLDSNDRRPLELAIARGHLDSVKVFFENKSVDANEKINSDFTLLHLAARWGHLEIVKFLINGNASIYAENSSNKKPIHIAAHHGHLDVVKYFVQCDEELLNNRGKANNTLLHFAAQGGLEVVKYLIEKGMDVNESNDLGIDPISVAAFCGQAEIVETLLNNGAIFNSVYCNETGYVFSTKESIITSILLIAELFDSVKTNNLPYVRSLIDKGVCVNAKDSTKTSVLHYAAREGYDEITQILLNKKADPNAVDEKNASPLHYAAICGRIGAAKKLLGNGAVYNAETTDKKTPLDLATSEDMIDLLKFIDDAFKSVRSLNSVSYFYTTASIVTILQECESFDVFQSVMCAKNEKGETFVPYRICNDFPEYNDLKSNFFDESLNKKSTYDAFSVDIGYKIAINIDTISLQISQQYLVSENKNGKVLRKFVRGKAKYQEKINFIRELNRIMEQNFELESREELDKDTYAEFLIDLFDELTDISDEIEISKYDEFKHTYFNKCYDHTINYDAQNHNHFFMYVGYKIGISSNLSKMGRIGIALVADQTQRCKDLHPKTKEDFPEMFDIIQEIFEITQAKVEKNKLISHDLKTRSCIAKLLHISQQNSEAINIFEDVYPKQNEILGINNADTLKTLFDMALVLHDLERYEEALNAHNIVFEKYLEMYRSDSPKTLTSQNSIGITLNKLGRNDEALSVLRRVYESRKRILGSTHLHTVKTLFYTNVTLFELKKFHEAVESLREALNILKKSRGPENRLTLYAEIFLGFALSETNKHIESYTTLKESTPKLKSIVGGKDSLVLEAEKWIGNLERVFPKNSSDVDEGIAKRMQSCSKAQRNCKKIIMQKPKVLKPKVPFHIIHFSQESDNGNPFHPIAPPSKVHAIIADAITRSME